MSERYSTALRAVAQEVVYDLLVRVDPDEERFGLEDVKRLEHDLLIALDGAIGDWEYETRERLSRCAEEKP